MTDLIERLEAATAGSRELDAEIGALRHSGDCWALSDRPGYFRIPGCGSISSTSIEARHYTTSLDAALGLVPEGWTWHSDATLPSAGIDWVICHPDKHGPEFIGTGATPALALCIAALKARAP